MDNYVSPCVWVTACWCEIGVIPCH